MKRDVSLYLTDIVQNMDDAMEYVRGMTYDKFVKDGRTVKAVIRCVEVMGEAVKNLPPEVCSLAPEVPWRDMARMRDKCIHFYFGVDHEIIWLAATKSIPEIRPKVSDLAEKVRTGENREKNKRG